MLFRFSLALLCLLFCACGASSEDKLMSSYFDALYKDKSTDALLARMLPFFAGDVREKRLPVYSAQTRLSEKIRSHEIYDWRRDEKDGRLTISASLREIPRTGAQAEKGFIARFAKQYSPDGKDFLWRLYDIIFSTAPAPSQKTWLDLADLAPDTRALLSALTNDTSVMIFGRVADSPAVHILREIASHIPAEVSFSWHDPDIDRGLAASYGIPRTPHIIIENGARRAVLQLADLSWEEAKPESESGERVLGAEQRLASAFLRVAGPPVHAVFIEGLNERALTGASPRALSGFVSALSNSGYLVRRESLGAALSDIPAALSSDQEDAETRILIFCDPRYSPSPGDEALLTEALAAGRARAVFLFDTPLSPWAHRTGAHFGFRPFALTVLDPSNKDSFKGARWIESLLSEHESTAHFVKRPAARFLIGEGIGALMIKDFTSSNFIAHPIVSCSGNGWASVDFDPEKPDEAEYEPGKDIPGPLHFGFAVSTVGEDSRPAAVFIGDADCVANELIQSRISNWLFTADLIAWLASAEAHRVPARAVPSEIRRYQ